MSLSFKNHRNVTVATLHSDWKRFKDLIALALQKNDYDEAFRLLEGLGYFGWKYNFISDFSDDEAEQLISQLALKIHEPITLSLVNTNRIVFYDFFAWENRGFTQQYIDIIIKNNFELLYVIENESKYDEKNAIFQTIINYQKGSIFILPSKFSKSEKLNLFLTKIIDFAPSKIFIHNSPWDALSCCVGYLLQKTKVKTYLLNITDNTFWFGKKCFSYFIDFRQFGSQLNNELRKIPLSQLLIIHTPPFINEKATVSFKGFPVDTQNKIIGFAGGNTHKIFDKKKTFLNLIKLVLKENSNFIFLFADVGCDDELLKFIKQNNLQNQFILIGNRKDINEVFKKIDIFFNTYPYGGGLMLQYAVANKKPILSFYNKNLIHTRIDKVLDIPKNETYIINNKKHFLNTAKHLINDEAYRTEFAKGVYSAVSTQHDFERILSALLLDKILPPINYMDTFEFNSKALTKFHIINDKLYGSEYVHLANTYLNKNIKHQKYKINYFQVLRILKKITPNKLKEFLIRGLAKLIFKVLNSPVYQEKIKWKKHLEIEELKKKFKSFGEYSTLPEANFFYNPQYISIGKSFHSLYNLRIEAIDSWKNQTFSPKIIIGDNVSVNTDCHIGSINKVSIGNNVLIASRVYISDHSHGDVTLADLDQSPINRTLFSKGPVIIEDDVWIGEGACILPGVTIGKHSIIGANSVVNKSIDAYSVVAGVPAKMIKSIAPLKNV